MNNCAFIGRVGKDAVLRHTQGGDPVAGWSLATDAGYGDKKVTTWIDCSLWGKRAEKLAEFIKKGDRIAVVGELSTREHEGKTYVTLKVAEVTLLGEKKEGQRQDAPAPRQQAPAQSFEQDEEIPFDSRA